MFDPDTMSAAAMTHALALGLVFLLALLVLRVAFAAFVYIPNTHFGVIERKWCAQRSPEPFGPMALRGNAGFLPDVIRGGWHVLVPFQYRVYKQPLINVDQIGYLVARVGRTLEPGQALGEWPAEVQVDDARGFLEQGGQAGPQRRILRSGTYAINTALFAVIGDDTIHHLVEAKKDDAQFQALLQERGGFTPIVIKDDKIGIVTVQDGPALQHGEIIAPTVGTDANNPAHFHNSFQDIGRFLAAGGRRGRQEQVLVEGTYFLNRLFATVEVTGKRRIEIGTVGVINSFVGRETEEAITAENGRGRTVEVGQRGIWRRPLEPGKYAVNPYAAEVIDVPTTNFQLRWIAGVVSAAALPNGKSYDNDLKEIPVITRDAFEILVPLSIVAHIAPVNAPHVIQRFSQIERLVNQTLDPFVSSYFKDTAQRNTLLDFIEKRVEIGKEALKAMKERLAEHRIEIEEVMIGTPKPTPGDTRMEAMLEQLRARQLAKEEQKTFVDQQEAATKRKALNEQLALADQQAGITKSELSIRIAENEGAAETARKRKAADGIRIMAEAEGSAETARKSRAAEGIRVMAEAEAFAAKAKAESIGGTDNLIRQAVISALVEIARETKMPLVPSVVVGGETANGIGGLPGLLLAMAGRDLLPSTDSLAESRSR
ncbi:SPFH domain-containing protein [Lichenifustis flavocetrariae]|uniref:SPFH domain-containing protein n=1 Tax=Lichenifustis flavocetrariae TaxID=2949735 RepID=A0AA41YXJ8_9HYPH|nr:SPFH domain-containing protein [Lichenifustis flavocetrariae]MCW6509150.1 SPFH domain-containing protein [Lichenifustis flavocetrariae]